jgi:hypothetical protein
VRRIRLCLRLAAQRGRQQARLRLHLDRVRRGERLPRRDGVIRIRGLCGARGVRSEAAQQRAHVAHALHQRRLAARVHQQEQARVRVVQHVPAGALKHAHHRADGAPAGGVGGSASSSGDAAAHAARQRGDAHAVPPARLGVRLGGVAQHGIQRVQRQATHGRRCERCFV